MKIVTFIPKCIFIRCLSPPVCVFSPLQIRGSAERGKKKPHDVLIYTHVDPDLNLCYQQTSLV